MKKDLRIAFFGNAPLALPVLTALKEAGLSPVLIVTQESKPKGRGLTITDPETKVWAESAGIEVIQPANVKDDPTIPLLLNSEWDLFVVAAYGKILPREILALPKHGTLNVHPSLLPKLRGASPVRTAILRDEVDAVGATVILLDEKMDHGPIVSQARIVPEEWPMGALMLEQLLAQVGADLLVEAIPLWIKGEITPEEQNHDAATYSEKITKEMGLIDPADGPRKNICKIKALEGWPGTYFFTERNGKNMRIKITDAKLTEDGELDILKIIPEGKKEMEYKAFLRGS